MANQITKKRSVFNLTHSVKTSSSFGVVTPLLSEFVTPDTTLKNGSDMYLEMKPTVAKLNSTITSNLQSFFVPLKRVWKFADNFLASTNHFNQTAAMNEPQLHSFLDLNIDKMPRISMGRLFNMLLASCSKTTCDISATGSTELASIARYKWNYLEEDETIVKTTNENWAPFWLSRLIGTGYEQNPTYNVMPLYDDGQQIGLAFNTSNPQVLEMWNQFSNRNDSFLSLFVRQFNDTLLYWYIEPISYINERPFSAGSYHFCATNINPQYYGNTYYNTSSQNLDKIFIDVLLYGLFGSKNLFGFGSLTESLGCPLFSIYSNSTNANVSYPRRNVQNIVTTFATRWEENTLTPKASFNISPLMFFAYQAILTDRYLLPKDILSPVTPLTGVPRNTYNYAHLDSDYCHNYVVPTTCYENEALGLVDLWEGCVSNAGEYALSFYGITDPTSIAKRLQASVTFNQLISVFLDRSPLVDSDIYTHFWQVPDKNVTSILFNVSQPIVDASRKADAKQMAITKKLSEFLKRGGWTCTADEFIEKHFGVRDSIDSSCEVVTIARDSKIIEVQDVINTGGASDVDGNSLPLGAKSSIASNANSHRCSFEFYSKDYGFFMMLHHLSVSNDYWNAPDPVLKRLGNIKFDDFALMTAPEFQDTGDEPIYCDDVELGVVSLNPAIAWREKNWFLKDKANRCLGDYNTLYRNQVISPLDSLWNTDIFAELSYRYLQKSPFDYSRYFVDSLGDNLLINLVNHEYKKAPMTRNNVVGMY